MEAAMRRNDMRRLIVTCACAAMLAGAMGSASAEEENRVKRDAKQAGHDMKSGIVEFGRGMRDVAKDVGHGAAKVGKEIGHTAKDAPRDVKEGFKNGDKRKEPRGPRLADP
jgi:hypothetical protein